MRDKTIAYDSSLQILSFSVSALNGRVQPFAQRRYGPAQGQGQDGDEGEYGREFRFHG